MEHRNEKTIDHMLRVNNWDIETASNYIKQQFDKWGTNSRFYGWTIDSSNFFNHTVYKDWK